MKEDDDTRFSPTVKQAHARTREERVLRMGSSLLLYASLLLLGRGFRVVATPRFVDEFLFGTERELGLVCVADL